MEGKRRMNSVEDGGKEKNLVFLSGVPNKLDRNP